MVGGWGGASALLIHLVASEVDAEGEVEVLDHGRVDPAADRVHRAPVPHAAGAVELEEVGVGRADELLGLDVKGERDLDVPCKGEGKG